jgi:hypothetical protein
MVGGHQLLRGCEDCDYSERFILPDLKKNILYLDQFFFSHCFRAATENVAHLIQLADENSTFGC